MSADLDQSDFRIVFRGYDREQVDELHKQAHAYLTSLQAENDKLKEALKRSLEQGKTSQAPARYADETLIIAQKTADEITANAHTEAEKILQSAQGKGEGNDSAGSRTAR